MNNDRRIATLTGVLYIIGTVAGVSSVFATMGLADAPDILKAVAAHSGQASFVAFLILVMGLALAAIPALVFPVLRRWNEPLAVGYVIFRGGLETLAAIGAALTWLLLVTVAQQHAVAGAASTPLFSNLAALLLKAQEPMGAIGAIVFGIGGLMFTWVLYHARLIPRWISVWGFIGLTLYVFAGVGILFGLSLGLLELQLLPQEMVMAGWLIAKGFNTDAVAPTRDRLPRAGWKAAEVN
jgi:hypothetical protein